MIRGQLVWIILWVYLFLYIIHHVMHTCIMLTLFVLEAIVDSCWVGKEGRFVKEPSTSMSKSTNGESRLDWSEVRVAEIVKQLQVLIDVVASWTVPHIADNRSFCNQNERIIGEPSRVKHTSSEIAPVRNRQFPTWVNLCQRCLKSWRCKESES